MTHMIMPNDICSVYIGRNCRSMAFTGGKFISNFLDILNNWDFKNYVFGTQFFFLLVIQLVVSFIKVCVQL